MSQNGVQDGGRTGLPRAGAWSLLLALCTAVSLVILPSRLGAQETEAPGPPPRISVGEISGPAGASLMIPLYYDADPQKPLRSITVEIEYISNNLKFMRVAKGLAADAAEAEITANVTDGSPDGEGLTRSKLRVSAAAGPGKTLEEGLQAYLLYNISLDAKPFAIKMNTSIVSAEGPNAPQDVASVHADPGLVVIEVLDVMPEATCFFFTH